MPDATKRMLGWRQHARRRQRLPYLAVSIGALIVLHDAHAQSSVTLYGALDTSIEVTNPGAGWTPRLDSGAYRGSRFGIRGAEPIGAHTRILFELENGFSSADGSFASANTIFSRQAWIGVGAPWGEVRIGRQYSPIYIPFKGQLDAFGAGTIASGLNNLSKITPYVNNALTYLSPDFHGLSATTMVSLRDGGATGGNGLAGHFETIDYRRGPLHASFAHQQTNGSGALRANLGGVSYLIGGWTAFVSFFNGYCASPSYHDDGLSVSARYAVTPRFRASFGYTYMRDRSGAGNDADQFSVACEYELSKKLLLYASAASLRNRGSGAFTLRGVNVTGLPVAYPGAPVRGFQIGMIDRF